MGAIADTTSGGRFSSGSASPDVRRPSTLCAALVGSESCVRTAGVVSPGAVNEPPFSSNAFAGMLSPSASTSPACTTYSKLKVVHMRGMLGYVA